MSERLVPHRSLEAKKSRVSSRFVAREVVHIVSHTIKLSSSIIDGMQFLFLRISLRTFSAAT